MAAWLYKWLMVYLLPFSLGQGKQALADNPGPDRIYHPFYISVTEINHNAKDKTLEISCKLFADDLEQILEKNYKTTLDISAEKDKPSFDKFIPDYINRHLGLAVDGKAVKFSYVGFEKEKESAYCYFQVDNIASLKKLDLFNSILHDFNTDQINIMHVTVNGKRQSTKLDYPATKAGFNF
jgi:hypothetical protein